MLILYILYTRPWVFRRMWKPLLVLSWLLLHSLCFPATTGRGVNVSWTDADDRFRLIQTNFPLSLSLVFCHSLGLHLNYILSVILPKFRVVLVMSYFPPFTPGPTSPERDPPSCAVCCWTCDPQTWNSTLTEATRQNSSDKIRQLCFTIEAP